MGIFCSYFRSSGKAVAPSVAPGHERHRAGAVFWGPARPLLEEAVGSRAGCSGARRWAEGASGNELVPQRPLVARWLPPECARGGKAARTPEPSAQLSFCSSGGRCGPVGVSARLWGSLPASYQTARESDFLRAGNSATTAHVVNPDMGYCPPEGSWEPQVSFSSFRAKARPGSALWRSLSPTVPALPVVGTGRAGMSREGPPGEKRGRGLGYISRTQDRPGPSSARGSLGARAHPLSSPALCG